MRVGMTMKLMNRMLPLTLRQKLIVSAILCLLFPAAIALVISDYTTKDVIKNKAVEDSLGTLEVMDRYIQNTVSKMLYVSNYIQLDDEINTIVRHKWNESKQHNANNEFVEDFLNSKKVTEKLENISFPGDKTHITILLPDGTNYTNYSYLEYEPKVFFEEPWFKGLQDKPAFSTNWIGTHPSYMRSDQVAQEHLITIAKTMKYFSSEAYGYLIVSLNEEQISNIFVNNSSSSETMLLDADGTILSHTENARIGQQFPYYNEFKDGSDLSIMEIEGREYLLLKRTLNISDWMLVNMLPYKDALGKIQSIQHSNFLFQLLFLSLFLIILISLIRRITRPVLRLGRVASQVEEGNLQIRSNIRGADEMGRLGHSFDQMLDRIEHMFKQIHYEQSRKRKAELEMLQAQINPHFLFNILNSIRLRILLKGDKESASLISSLSRLLRMTINRNNEYIALHEETEIVLSYVRLMNFRHEWDIEIETALAKDTLMEQVPRFFMQPIIENSLIHGLRDQQGVIIIRTWKDSQECLTIEVSDNGKGIDPSKVEALQRSLSNSSDTWEPHEQGFSGIGLKNVYERLKLIYGTRFEFAVKSNPDHGTVITITIPSRSDEPYV
jgi:two-component system sensor histidine kinase YesM